MLKSDERVLSHVGADGSGLELLEDFRAANPQLAPVEWDGRGAFCRQFWHLAFLDHREYSPGMGRDCCYADVLDLFFTDHEELWRDVVTGDLVHVAHPYSWSEGSPGFVEGVDFLKSRGLNFVVSEGSWYSPGWTKLVVVARPRTLDRVGFPSGVLYFSAVVEERETERLVVMARAGEQFDVDWWVAGAREAEAGGDFHRAVLLFVDMAHTERTGRFNRRAVRYLREAGRLLGEHYRECVVLVGTRGFLSHGDARLVFRFAGLEVPGWVERMWANRSRPWDWSTREERGDGLGFRGSHRCVGCEKWMEEGERMFSLSLGWIHRDYSCLAGLVESDPAPVVSGPLDSGRLDSGRLSSGVFNRRAG